MAVENLTIEAVNNKPKFPKYNSGAILVDGIWMNVAKTVDIEQIMRGTTITGEVVTNEKGYKLLTKLIVNRDLSGSLDGQALNTNPVTVGFPPIKTRDFDKEARGKTKCALYAATLASPFMAQFGTTADFKSNADDLVEYFTNKVFED